MADLVYYTRHHLCEISPGGLAILILSLGPADFSISKKWNGWRPPYHVILIRRTCFEEFSSCQSSTQRMFKVLKADGCSNYVIYMTGFELDSLLVVFKGNQVKAHTMSYHLLAATLPKLRARALHIHRQLKKHELAGNCGKVKKYRSGHY